MGLVTVAEAAQQLDLSPVAVRQFIAEGRLRATKYGRTWLLERAEVARFARRKRAPGRPKS